MVASLAAVWWMLAQTVPDANPTALLIGAFAGQGIAGILAVLYILDLRKRDAANTTTVATILGQISPVLGEVRDVLRADVEAHRAAAEAARATSEALERFAQQLPSADERARVRIALERMDGR